MVVGMIDFKTIEELKGKTLAKVEAGDDEVVFECADGTRYQLWHQQDCCESVAIREIEGDLSNLIGEVTTAREEQGHQPPGFEPSESFTLTDFIVATQRGQVTFKWLGESNGYYSESVTFSQLT